MIVLVCVMLDCVVLCLDVDVVSLSFMCVNLGNMSRPIVVGSRRVLGFEDPSMLVRLAFGNLVHVVIIIESWEIEVDNIIKEHAKREGRTLMCGNKVKSHHLCAHGNV